MNKRKIELRYLKGVGENREKLLNKLGIDSVDALLCHYPRKYIDFREPASLSDVSIYDSALYRLTVLQKKPPQRTYGNRTITRVLAEGEGIEINLIYFNNIYTPASLLEGNSYFFYGKILRNLISNEMYNPWLIKETETQRLLPFYPTTEGLSSRFIEKTVKTALTEFKSTIEETLPESILQKYNLVSLTAALEKIHSPSSYSDVEVARRRLIFEELFIFQIGMLLFKERSKKKTGIVIIDNISQSFISSLPFKLTKAQERCIKEILTDIKQSTPMSRLLQGDVGSGKTIVAVTATAVCVNSSYQVAVMVPTEILASQHLDTFRRLLSPIGITVELLTGSVKGKKRERILENISTGKVNVVIGTHALISSDVSFFDLGLVVADEQHRFGVEQRSSLSKKGNNPHLLVMSATPIPRSLALIIYGDLDISIIDELPSGRKPIKTYLVDSSLRKRYLDFAKTQIDNDHQVYIVCPLIDVNESLDDRLAATEYQKQLESEFLSGYSIGLIHGRMKTSEKNKVMDDFREGNIGILISTTVIEVGLDVPKATTMVIENAEVFGLSTLHQLRGRIGRGSDESYCILVSKSSSKTALNRLNIMTKSSNGFEIAQHDLKFRGPGELFGRRQHGLPNLKIADLTKNEIVIYEAQDAAKKLLLEDKSLHNYPLIKDQLKKMFVDKDSGIN